MKGRNPSAEEKAFMNKMASIGCIACKKMGYSTPGVSIHHIDGRTKPGAHFYVLPLCGRHHQVPDTEKPPRWYALHANKRQFEAEYGTEQELLHECIDILKSKPS